MHLGSSVAGSGSGIAVNVNQDGRTERHTRTQHAAWRTGAQHGPGTRCLFECTHTHARTCTLRVLVYACMQWHVKNIVCLTEPDGRIERANEPRRAKPSRAERSRAKTHDTTQPPSAAHYSSKNTLSLRSLSPRTARTCARSFSVALSADLAHLPTLTLAQASQSAFEIIQLAISYCFFSPAPASALLPGSSNSCHFRCVPDNRTAENSLFAIAAHLCRKSVGHVRRRRRRRQTGRASMRRGVRLLGVVNVCRAIRVDGTHTHTHSFAHSFDLIV